MTVDVCVYCGWRLSEDESDVCYLCREEAFEGLREPVDDGRSPDDDYRDSGHWAMGAHHFR